MDNIHSRISIFLFMFATVFCTTETPDPCMHVWNQSGMENATCLIVTSCPYFKMLLDAKDLKQATKLSCGFEGKQPKVCCPAGEVPISYNMTEEIATNRPKLTSTFKPKVTTTIAPHKTTITPHTTTIAPHKTTITPHTTTIAPHTTEQTDSAFPSKAVCGKSREVSDRIVGGTIARVDEHPWLARIEYRKDNLSIFGCSASIITDRYLLTAAHCVTKIKPVSVRLGEWNTETAVDCYKGICHNNTIDIKVSKTIVHETFNLSRGADGDIALLQLEEPITFTEFIQPICLPITEYIAMQDYSPDSVYSAAGWGLTEFETESEVKRQVQLKATQIEVCRSIFKLKAESEPNIICAGGSKGKDTCRGDSGGPLIKLVSENYEINWYIFGIISLGSRVCGDEGVPGMYTRVSAYMDWIRKVVST